MVFAFVQAGLTEPERRWITDAYGPVDRWIEAGTVPPHPGYLCDPDARWTRDLGTGELTQRSR